MSKISHCFARARSKVSDFLRLKRFVKYWNVSQGTSLNTIPMSSPVHRGCIIWQSNKRLLIRLRQSDTRLKAFRSGANTLAQQEAVVASRPNTNSQPNSHLNRIASSALLDSWRHLVAKRASQPVFLDETTSARGVRYRRDSTR